MTLPDLHLGRPVTRGALTLFPLWDGGAVARPGYDVRPRHLTVDERAGAAVVAELVVANPGSRPALVAEGELFEGGQQHRVAVRTVLVPAGASAVVDVACVEHGRWSGTDRHARRGRRAPATVRARAAHGAGDRDEAQSQVWQEVARCERRHGGASPTASLLDTTDAVERRAAADLRGLRPLAGQTGLLVGVAGHPLLLEAYDSPRALAAAWDGLLAAAAVDAAGLPAEPTPGRRARRFLQGLTGARPVERVPAGLAVTTRSASPHARVVTTTWRDRAVHTVAVAVRHGLVAA